MTAWWSLITLMGVIGLSTVAQANNPLAIENTSKVSTTEAALGQLNLNELNADWWKPFADNKLRAAASDKLMAQLNQTWLSTPPDQRDAIEESLESIKRMLNTLKHLQEQPTATASETSLPIQDDFSWQDWLEALRKNQAAQTSVNEASAELARKEDGQKLLMRQVDDLTASYLSQTNTPIKTTLTLVEKRLTWLISQESIRLEKAQLVVTKQRAEAIERHFKHIQSNLTTTEKDLKNLQREAEQLDKTIEQSNDKLRNLEAILPTIIGDDGLTHAKQLQTKYAVLEAKLSLLHAQTKLGWNRLSETYVQRKQENQQDWSDAQRQLLSDQASLIEVFSQQHNEQRQLIERYREQTQSAFAIAESGSTSRDSYTARQIFQQLLDQSTLLANKQQTISQQLADNMTLLVLLKSQLRQDDGQFKGSLNDLSATAKEAWHASVGWLNTSLFKMGETPVTTAGIIRVMLIILIVWWFSYWLRKVITQLAGRNQKIADSTIYTLNRVLHYLIMLIGIMVALSSIGLDFSNVAWIAGALSVGIGFGLQSIVNNFVSGLIIMFERSLKVGDFLELQSGVTGTVSQINMRSTIVRTLDNLEIVVPNSEFISGRVVNWTLTNNERRLRIPFSVEYGTDKELVVKLVMQAARNVPYTLEDEDHEPQVWMTRMGDNGLEFELLVWIRQGVDIEVRRAESRQGFSAAYLWEIETAFRQSEIGMPFPQRDYHICSILGQTSVEGVIQALSTLKRSPIPTTPNQDSPG
jgi:small-conductance mechanosensitive channel